MHSARLNPCSYGVAPQETSRSMRGECDGRISYQPRPNRARRNALAVRLLPALVSGRRSVDTIHCRWILRADAGGRRRVETERCRLSLADALGRGDIYFYGLLELGH